jgi:O-antigen ligase
MKYLKLTKEKNIWMFLLPLAVALYLLFSMISISLSQIFIFFSFIFWLVILIQRKQKLIFPSFFWPLIAYSAFSLISSFLSKSQRTSLEDSRELLLFLIVPVVYSSFHEQKTLSIANRALLGSGILSCLYSVLYFIFKASPGERITGFMGHYMTQAGLLVLFSCMALSMFLFSKDKIRFLWGLGFILALVSLPLTLTRSAWVGLVIIVCIILLSYKPKFLIIIPVAIGLFFLLSPSHMKKRALSIFSLKTATNQARLEYIRAGIKVIKGYPLFGTGPNTVNVEIMKQEYGLSDDAKKDAVHLHNNVIQIGAERGLLTLLAWITFMVWTFASLVKLLKNKNPLVHVLSVAALAALFGLSTTGLFEYNFGDSEITTLFLYLITVPFSAALIQEKSQQING